MKLDILEKEVMSGMFDLLRPEEEAASMLQTRRAERWLTHGEFCQPVEEEKEDKLPVIRRKGCHGHGKQRASVARHSKSSKDSNSKYSEYFSFLRKKIHQITSMYVLAACVAIPIPPKTTTT